MSWKLLKSSQTQILTSVWLLEKYKYSYVQHLWFTSARLVIRPQIHNTFCICICISSISIFVFVFASHCGQVASSTSTAATAAAANIHLYWGRPWRQISGQPHKRHDKYIWKPDKNILLTLEEILSFEANLFQYFPFYWGRPWRQISGQPHKRHEKYIWKPDRNILLTL